MFKRSIVFLIVSAFLTVSVPAQKFDYPKPRRGDQVDDYHGTKVADPYRWMEDTESAETKAWIEAENKLTNSYLSTIPQRDGIKKRLTEIWNYERYSAPSKITDNFYIYTKNDGLQNQSVLYKATSINDPGKVFFDPNKLRADGTAALGGSAFTDDGKLWAYGVSQAGSDRSEWFVMDVATGKLLPDTLSPNRQGVAAWLKDNSGFYYTSYPPAEKGQELKNTTYFQKLYFHKLGTPQSEDYVVYERPDNKEYFCGAEISEDGNWLIITVGKGTERMNMVYFKNLTMEKAPILPLVENLDNAWNFLGNDGSTFYFQTDKGASRGKVVKVDALAVNKNWVDVIPETPDTLNGVQFLNDQFVLNYMHDAYTKIKIFNTNGKWVRDVALPGIGTAGGFGGKRKDHETFYSYSSYNAPPTIYRYDMKTGKSTVFRTAKVKFDPNTYEVKQVFYPSKDGTKVPMFLTYKKGTKLDGSNPTILYGYGGFNIASTPGFSIARVPWLEMGGIYAVACIRGGSEYGKDWWKGGSRLNKQNVFDDFAYAGKWLIANKYTSTPKLAIQGGSNGGLLVGAVLNQNPDLFGAALPAVGVMDMLRFDKFTIGWAWKSDYGDPADPTDFKAMYAYSPYHNAKPGTKYPATLVTTADHDDRVFPAHSFKYTAAMQAAQAGDAPVLIRIQVRGGHGAGLPTALQIEQQADIYGFLVKNLGMK
ncbi:MAG TPA: prolyl oligopeptidase family serine peptidase [Pyrinomonadaceae bacterium]|nr:S9 family peptidase [Acidobacteriota bacterium]HQZ96890.1 prolyl oligopeptidase family serine peptidase [Pyrinomonadaceae bacterium]